MGLMAGDVIRGARCDAPAVGEVTCGTLRDPEIMREPFTAGGA